MSRPSPLISLRPDSQDELTGVAERWLRAAGVWGKLPTPADTLYQTAKIAEHDMLELIDDSGGLRRALENAEEGVRAAWQKILGIADLRRKVVYIAKDMPQHRRRFTQFHEFAHQAIPWHDVRLRYRDRAHELRPDARALFEREANFMGSELMYQGNRFRTRTQGLRGVDFPARQHARSLPSRDRMALRGSPG